MRKSIENLGGRKLTGGRIIPNRTRRKYEIDRYPNEPTVGETKNVIRRVRGNNVKVAFKFAEYAFSVTHTPESLLSSLSILSTAQADPLIAEDDF